MSEIEKGFDNKRLKTKDNSPPVVDSSDDGTKTKTIHDNPCILLSMLNFKRVLNENSNSKLIVIEAEHNEQNAVVILEKIPFSEDNIKQILNDANPNATEEMNNNKPLKCDFHNDIYGNYIAYPRSELNGIKTTIIHPATEKHTEKYLKQRIYIVNETPDNYNNITLPHVTSQQFSLNWLYNILDHKSEAERIVYEDMDPDVGFVLLPDMKWDGKQMDNLYCVAICRNNGIKSLRDLTPQHLPLLENIKLKGCDAIKQKYGIGISTLRIYIHYQPSYYHFHVHFTALTCESVGSHVERAHLLESVINNIILCPDYYQRSTLLFPVKENDALFSLYQKQNLLK